MLLAASVVFTSLAVTAQVEPKQPANTQAAPAVAAANQEAPKKSPGVALVDKGSYADALPLLEAELKADPQSRDLLYAKVEALSGLGHFIEARSLAMQTLFSHKEWPEFRYQAGECSWNLGQAQQAIQAWTPLFSDPDWGDLAITKASRALRASGREAEAKQLVLGAVAKQEKPTPALLNEALDLDGTGPGCLKIIDKLIAADPPSKDDYANLRKLYSSIGDGKLLDESLSGSLPVTIPLKERSESQEFAALGMGGYNSMSNTWSLETNTSVVAPVSINGGGKEWMVLDSGTTIFMVSPSIAKANGLEPVATAQYIGLGTRGTRASNWVVLRTLTLGPLTLKNVPAIIIDKQTDFWKTTAGIFPMAALRNYGILYDRRHGKLTLYPPKTPPETALGQGIVTIPSLWVFNRPYFSVKVNDKPNVFGMLDTGADRTMVDAEKAKELGVKVNVKYSSQSFTGMSGNFLTGVANDTIIYLGGAKMTMGTVQVTRLSGGNGLSYSVIVGRDILDLFNIYFDYQGGICAFKGYDR
jgi:tetratricopeptide (TPR) repeat protein